MTGDKLSAALLVALLVGATAALVDLRATQRESLVVYTTPALKEVLENDVIPRFTSRTGIDVIPMYIPAGQQYNRLRIGSRTPEADVFLHASPMYLEKGYAEGRFEPYELPRGLNLTPEYMSRPVEGGRIWHAFAWTPLVTVYNPRFEEAPDYATTTAKLGLAHPLLSNNGIYAVVLFEKVSREAGQNALAHAASQPTNARATVNGVADGSYDAALGYEAATRFYQEQGASVRDAIPTINGTQYVVPVLFSAGIVKDHRNPHAKAFIDFLFDSTTQFRLNQFDLRPVLPDYPTASDALPVTGNGIRQVPVDWSRWREFEAALPRYEVKA
ncbi:MAG TPA: extracellular solute-binding protein [Candidatus Thermoplasmatota archaeon]|nr:extracellular solute-binding protein [Candidatus Thermoplasmatota archaeon]